MSVNIKGRVEQYLALRDKIKAFDDEHKEKMAPYREALEMLNEVLLNHLNQIKSDSASVNGVGTVYRTVKDSASLADASAFMDFVVENAQWDLLDRRANVTAVRDYMQANAGDLPPGVNFSRRFVAGVRRK